VSAGLLSWRRRRRELNRALHELRRPLQALTLLEEAAGPGQSAGPVAARRGLIELLGLAAGDLDRAVNGGRPNPPVRSVSCHELVVASVERRRAETPDADAIRVFWDAGPAIIEADPTRIAQALDNLLANAIEHGSPPVVITGARVAGNLRITVANRGSDPVPGRRDPRRGHGVPIVSEIAAAHGGRFALCQTGSGCVAALELPLADVGAARAA
jgi:signal transduction histidine kinase